MSFKGVSRDQRDHLLVRLEFLFMIFQTGKSISSPPVGVYSPKYDIVTSQGKAMIKFNYSPSRDQNASTKASNAHSPSLPIVASKKSLDQLPAIITNMRNNH